MVMKGTDMKVADTPTEGLTDFRIPDAYEDWLEKEGVLVHTTHYIPNMWEIEVGPWERKGGKGAVVHIDNSHLRNDMIILPGSFATEGGYVTESSGPPLGHFILASV